MSEYHDGPRCESCIQDGEYGFDSDYCCCEAVSEFIGALVGVAIGLLCVWLIWRDGGAR